MSNKTQLATNNTQLASLIQTLQGKAAGGRGAVETCTVTTLYGIFGIVTYSNGTQIVSNDANALYEPGSTITVAKNSLIYISDYDGGGLDISGEATKIYGSTSKYVIAVAGDCELDESGLV